jgi:hypothetical protein
LDTSSTAVPDSGTLCMVPVSPSKLFIVVSNLLLYGFRILVWSNLPTCQIINFQNPEAASFLGQSDVVKAYYKTLFQLSLNLTNYLLSKQYVEFAKA